MRVRNPFVTFWIAVFVAVLSLGVAWSAWKAIHAVPLALVAAVPATLVCAVATLAAARIVVIVTRAARVNARDQ
jgi:hypothetical protein